tara:strand:+ start:27612 stop:28421 length:810 start_codon:yes stop_codon:yes gene_type:complete
MKNTTHIDVSALAKEFDLPVTVLDAFVNRFAPTHVSQGAYQATSDVLLFVHIPKTAGMSVGRSLREAFDVFRGVDWTNKAKSFRDETRAAVYTQSRANSRQVIMGHYGWSELQIWRNHNMPLKCGTILRDPVARVVSNYNYNCSPKHPLNETFKGRFPTLDDYVVNLPLDVQVTQAAGLICSFENLLDKLNTHYSFLGVAEHLNASLTHLWRSHGLPAQQTYRENTGPRSQVPPLSLALRKIIQDRSHNDCKLHDLLTRLYTAAAPAKE